MLEFLISKSADLTTDVKGLIWGKGYEWDMLIPAVNPISYAMMGTAATKIHRHEATISEIVSRLLKAAYGIDYKPSNILNACLRK